MRRRLVIAVVSLMVVAACSGDDGDDASESPDDDARLEAQPEVAGCTFTPDPEGTLVVGTVTVEGHNPTAEVIDTTSISFTLVDESGASYESYTSVTYWQPGEVIAMQAGILEDGPIESADCEITDVSTGSYAEQTTFDHSGAICEIVEPDGAVGVPGPRVDISGVDDAPSDVELFASGAVLDGDVRIGEFVATFEPGAAEAAPSMVATGEGLTCTVLELRLP